MSENLDIAATLTDALNMPSKSNVDLFSSEFAEPQLETPSQPTGEPRHQPQQPSQDVSLQGLSKDDLDALKDFLYERRCGMAASEFVRRHGPQGDGTYEICQHNTNLMQQYMLEFNLDFSSVTDMERAHQALAEAAEKGTEPQPPSNRLRVAPKQEPTREVSTGLSDSYHPAPQNEEENDLSAVAQQLHSMPIDDARREMQKLMRQRSQQRSI